MSALQVNRTVSPLRFDVGIGQAGYSEVLDAPGAGAPQQSLLPGSTTVSQAVEELFPTGRSVADDVLRAMVAANPADLRTASGFNAAARSAAGALRQSSSPAARRAAREIDVLLADADFFEFARATLLET